MQKATDSKPERRSFLRRFWIRYTLAGLVGAIAFATLFAHLLAQPRWLFSLATQLKPGAHYAVKLSADKAHNEQPPYATTAEGIPKVVALTIDDGPSEKTAEILAVLEAHKVKATFFNISGNLPGHEAAVRQAVASGHELANHLTADEASIRLTPDAFEADLLSAEAALEAFLPDGDTLRWLRPGMGFYNAEMVSTAERHGYQLVLGSRFPYDTHVHSPKFASAFVTRTLQPGDIIVLHDGEGEGNRGQRTLQALEAILPVLQAKGYTVTTVSELMELADSQ